MLRTVIGDLLLSNLHALYFLRSLRSCLALLPRSDIDRMDVNIACFGIHRSANLTKERVSRANINLHNHRKLYTTFFISPLGRRLKRVVVCRSFSIDLKLPMFGPLRCSSNWLILATVVSGSGTPLCRGALWVFGWLRVLVCYIPEAADSRSSNAYAPPSPKDRISSFSGQTA